MQTLHYNYICSIQCVYFMVSCYQNWGKNQCARKNLGKWILCRNARPYRFSPNRKCRSLCLLLYLRRTRCYGTHTTASGIIMGKEGVEFGENHRPALVYSGPTRVCVEETGKCCMLPKQMFTAICFRLPA